MGPMPSKVLPALPSFLNRALDTLERDPCFLPDGGVFTEDLVEAWIALKRQGARDRAERPHPGEWELHLDP